MRWLLARGGFTDPGGEIPVFSPLNGLVQPRVESRPCLARESTRASQRGGVGYTLEGGGDCSRLSPQLAPPGQGQPVSWASLARWTPAMGWGVRAGAADLTH